MRFLTETVNGCYHVQSVSMATTTKSKAQVNSILYDLEPGWMGEDYDMLKKNCTHFSIKFCEELGVGTIPKWIFRAGNIGKGAMAGINAVKSGGKSGLHAMGITGPGLIDDDGYDYSAEVMKDVSRYTGDLQKEGGKKFKPRVFMLYTHENGQHRLLWYDNYESSKPNGEVELAAGSVIHRKKGPSKGRDFVFRLKLADVGGKSGSNRMEALVLSPDNQADYDRWVSELGRVGVTLAEEEEESSPLERE